MRHRLRSLRRPARSLRRAGSSLGVLALAACGTPPPTHFHSLMPTEIAARAARAGGERRRRPPRADPRAGAGRPAAVAGPARRRLDGRCSSRSAGPARCATSSSQALLEELIVGQGAIDARTQPGAGRRGDAVAIDVRRFDSLPGREARIEGSWTITGSDARSASRCEWLIREAAPGSFAGARRGASARRRPARRGDRSGARAHAARRSGSCPALDSPLASRAARPRAATGQGRRATLFCTVFTPRTFMAMLSAVLFSSGVLATPDSTTLPFAVSTLIAAASTVLSSTSRALTVVVIDASST